MRFTPAALAFGLLMLAALALAHLLAPRPAPESARPHLPTLIPKQFGAWRQVESLQTIMPAANIESEVLAARLFDQLEQRIYINDAGEQVMLVAGYGSKQSGTLKAHRQEVCYQSQGSEIRDLAHGILRLSGGSIPVTRMVAVKPRRIEPVTYWFTLNDRALVSQTDWLRTQLASGLLQGHVPDGMLMRVSSLSTSPDTAVAFLLHERFVRELADAVPPGQRWRLVGRASGAE
jgi:EpsI family protein